MNTNTKNKLIVLLILLLNINPLFANDQSDVTIGVKVMVGGRYDNMRMCVASPAGAKGGPMADVMFVTRVKVNDEFAVTAEIPVMRPILFAASFKMLQFEPLVSFEFNKKINEDFTYHFGPGVGLSFHYGPDYKSENKGDARGESFFAMGPTVSAFSGFGYKNNNGKLRMVNLRAFYTPIFTNERDDLSPGTILGGSIEEQFYF